MGSIIPEFNILESLDSGLTLPTPGQRTERGIQLRST